MELYKVLNIDDKIVGKRIDEYLKEEFNYSSRLINKMKFEFNGFKVSSKRKFLNVGTLKIFYQDKGTSIIPIKMDLDIVYEDDNLLLVNKPPFLLTHPTQKKADKTLANGVMYYFEKNNINSIPRFYNRLDMNTSGIIVIAKNSQTQYILQSEKTKIVKKYLVIVEGLLDFEEKIIEEKIYYPEDGTFMRIVDEKGKYAKTKVKLIKKYENLNVSLVECELFTGRTHQIRVHMKHIGFPLIGDELYNSNSKYSANRQYLHSYYISIDNDEFKIEKEIDMFDDMKMYLL